VNGLKKESKMSVLKRMEQDGTEGKRERERHRERERERGEAT
jgi:hypothetical protein